MTDAVTAVANAMRADAEVLRAISQNVANAQTPAYRREIPIAYTTFDALAGVLPGKASAADASQPALTLASSIDLRPGTLQHTGEPLHVAVEGGGFFVVNTAQGERLTRRGDFRLDAEGRLVTASGNVVLGTNGPIELRAGQPTIAADGTVRAGENVVDRLRLVQVTNPAALQTSGDGLYALADAEAALESGAVQVRQGFLETSNVQSVEEMISLMETMRHFETAQRFIRGYDSMVDEAITTLGKV